MELLNTKENFFNKTVKEQVNFFAQGGRQTLGLDIETLGLKKFAEEIFNAPMKKKIVAETSRTLKSRIKTLLEKTYIATSGKNVPTFLDLAYSYAISTQKELENSFKSALGNNYKSKFKTALGEEYNDNLFRLKVFGPFIRKFIQDKKLAIPVTSISNPRIGELRGEEMFGFTIKENTNSLVVQIGTKKESDARITARDWARIFSLESTIQKYSKEVLTQKAPSNIKKSSKGMNKMARGDMIITSNKTGRTTLIQSKNLGEKAEKVINNNKMKSTSFYSPHAGENIFDFVDRVEKYTGTDIDTSSMAYTLANIIWFISAGSIKKGEDGPATQIPDAGMAEIIQELSIFVIDLLGIVYEDTIEGITIIPEISNLFYLVSNEYLIPTFLILEDIVEIMKGDISSFTKTKSYLQLTLTSSLKSKTFNEGEAIDLKKEKKESVGYLDGGEYYKDTALVDVGKKKGYEIVSHLGKGAFNFKGLFANFNIDKMVNSSYNF